MNEPRTEAGRTHDIDAVTLNTDQRIAAGLAVSDRDERGGRIVSEDPRIAEAMAHPPLTLPIPEAAPPLSAEELHRNRLSHPERLGATGCICDLDAARTPDPASAIEGDAGRCLSCGLRECVGRLQYENCTHPLTPDQAAKRAMPIEQAEGYRPIDPKRVYDVGA